MSNDACNEKKNLIDIHSHGRRKCDTCGSDGHGAPCDELTAQISIGEQILIELREMKETQESMKDMLTAWNNTKGFVTTIKTAGKLILWLVALGAAWAIMSETIKHWLTAR